MTELQKIPLFPLNTVLFPGMVLPLHIFEERYKLMVYRCVTENKPFGVALIQEGSEVGGAATTVCSIGTTAQITKIDPLDDGRMNIAALGFNRFKIREIFYDQPYLVASVEEFPLQQTDSHEVNELARQVSSLLLHYITMIASLSDVEVELEKLPNDAATLAFLAAIVLRAPSEDKQQLLNIASLPQLLREEKRLLAREAGFLRLMVEDAPAWTQLPRPFSPN